MKTVSFVDYKSEYNIKLPAPFLIDLDVLVNNAGATWGAPLDEYPDAAFQKVMNLNVNRIFTLTQA